MVRSSTIALINLQVRRSSYVRGVCPKVFQALTVSARSAYRKRVLTLTHTSDKVHEMTNNNGQTKQGSDLRYGSKYGPQDHEAMVSNILDTYASASAQCLADGQRWYAVAHAHAQRLAAEYGVSVNTVAMVIAALSPRLNWTENLAAAEFALQGVKAHKLLGFSYAKAKAVLRGETPHWPRKTDNFRELIATGGNDWSVCVDTHSIIVAYGFDPGSKEIRAIFANRGGLYDTIWWAYVEAARRARIKPYVMQATTWCARREVNTREMHGASVVEV